MHYTESELYFFNKKDLTNERIEEITAHLALCPECRKKASKMASLSRIVSSSLLDPPKQNPAAKAIKAAPGIFSFLFNLKFAAAFTTVTAAAVFLFMCTSVSNKNAAGFVYDTYKTLYDFDYYYSNYIEETTLVQIAEVEK